VADRLLRSAWEHQRLAQMAQAESACREVLKSQPGRAEALYLLR
jgi:hypothetical protein